jgi:hypothetical protein
MARLQEENVLLDFSVLPTIVHDLGGGRNEEAREPS